MTVAPAQQALVEAAMNEHKARTELELFLRSNPSSAENGVWRRLQATWTAARERLHVEQAKYAAR